MLSLFPNTEKNIFNLYQNIPDAPARFLEKLGYDALIHVAKIRANFEVQDYKVNDQEFQVLVMGNPDGIPFVWLHGFADVVYSMVLPALKLQDKFRIYIPTIPGFDGDNENPDRKFNLDNYTNLFAGLFDQLFDKKFLLAGNSLGGAIALKYAHAYPDKLLKVYAVGTAGVIPDLNAGLYRELIHGRNLFHISDIEEFNQFLRRIYHRPPHVPFLIKAYLYNDFKKNGEWYNKIMKDLSEGFYGAGDNIDTKLVEDYKLDSKLPEIKVPVHVIWGVYDSLFPVEIGYYLKEKVPNGQISVLPSCGHCPHMEKPFAFASIFLND